MTRKKKKVNTWIVCVGMVCLTAAEMVALANGINGTRFSIYIAIIAAAIGIVIPTPKFITK